MTRGKSIYKVLGLWALIVILTGCAAEKDPLITSPLSYDKLTEPTMPKYPGGTEKMFDFIADNLRWPYDDESCIQGRVIVSFIVEKDGSLTDIKVEKSIDPLFDKEAVRVVKSMPKWEPGMWNGKPARVKFFVPIRFRLE
jgi:protein TonB